MEVVSKQKTPVMEGRCSAVEEEEGGRREGDVAVEFEVEDGRLRCTLEAVDVGAVEHGGLLRHRRTLLSSGEGPDGDKAAAAAAAATKQQRWCAEPGEFEIRDDDAAAQVEVGEAEPGEFEVRDDAATVQGEVEVGEEEPGEFEVRDDDATVQGEVDVGEGEWITLHDPQDRILPGLQDPPVSPAAGDRRRSLPVHEKEEEVDPAKIDPLAVILKKLDPAEAILVAKHPHLAMFLARMLMILPSHARLAVFLAKVLAVLIPTVLWSSRGQPFLAVQRLFTVFCCSSVLCAGIFPVSLARKVSWAFLLLVLVSYGGMLAFIIDATSNASAGMLVMQLTSLFAAGVAGYTIAERRERDGLDGYVAAAAANVASNKDKEERERALLLMVLCGCVVAIVLLPFALRVAWVLCHAADYMVEAASTEAMLSLYMSQLLWLPVVARTRIYVVAGAGQDVVLCWMLTVSCLAMVMMMLLAADAVVTCMIIAWFCNTAAAVFSGYCLAADSFYTRHIKLVRNKLAEVPAKKSDEQNQVGNDDINRSKHELACFHFD